MIETWPGSHGGTADAPQTVLLVGTFLSATLGRRSVCEELAQRLAAASWPVVTTSAKLPALPRLLDIVGTTWRQRERYVVAQVDVFSGRAFVWAEAACWILRRARKPFVLTLRGGNLPRFARQSSGRVRRLLQGAALVTTPSRYLLEQMAPYRADLRLLPNPIDIAAYPYRRRDRPQPRLIWLRAFHNMYNPSLAPRVVAALEHDYPDLQLVMVGPDKGDGSLQAMQAVSEQLGVSGRIILPGGVAKVEVPGWLDRGDIFLNTTNFDNTPVSVIEALACGLCVVSTDAGGVPYLLAHGDDALLVPPDDVSAMAAAVRRVLSEPGLAARLSEHARRKAEQFDWKIVLPQWTALLAEAVARGTP